VWQDGPSVKRLCSKGHSTYESRSGRRDGRSSLLCFKLRRRKETFFRDIEYEISRSGINQKFRLNILMDTGSKISFVKESIIPKEALESSDQFTENFHGINHSLLHVIGYIRLNVTLDSETQNDLTMLVVPDTTIVSPIVLGCDIMRKFGLYLKKVQAQAMDDILNIEISDLRDSIIDFLNIDTKIS